MTRHDANLGRLARLLRPSPERFAAAAALQDPSLLLRLQAEHAHDERPLRRRRGLLESIRAAIAGETGAALLLVAAVALALVWSNSPWQASYAAFWHATVALTVGPWTLGADLRTWIDEGLMTLFFLVVGLEAKRERDLGELREGRRLTVPVLAAVAGIATSAAVYLAVTAVAGDAGSGGWGVAISTDTALARRDPGHRALWLPRRSLRCVAAPAPRRPGAALMSLQPRPARHDHRPAAVRQRRAPPRGRVAGQDRADGDLEGAGRRARAWCGGSTSTATTRPTGSRTAASTAPSSSIRSTPTATGSASSDATTSATASSARTSPSRASPTTRSASATATGSAMRCSRSPSRA